MPVVQFDVILNAAWSSVELEVQNRIQIVKTMFGSVTRLRSGVHCGELLRGCEHCYVDMEHC